ncbi:MAG: Ig-like domain-containing protein [Kiritimatiellae bacterium]|nr:Ig-like domain-containing protein [Kiritimatiellia bacterium]MDW8457857.1 Ig-like domain-containing protein [Verrucomicrobiota bacterium]
MKPGPVFFAGWLCAHAAFALAATSGVLYAVRDLGALGGSSSRAHAVSERGEVVGEAETADGQIRAFLWSAERGMRDLGTLGGGFSRAYAVNDRGEVAGESEAPDGEIRPVRWREDTGMESLPLPPNMWDGMINGLNNFGIAVGCAETRNGPRALVWTIDGVAELAPLRTATESAAYGVNDVGWIIGRQSLPVESGIRSAPFLVDLINGKEARSRPMDTAQGGAALAINAQGVAVGYVEFEEGLRAARFDPGPEPSVRLIDTLENTYSIAFDINNRGEIVGTFSSSPEDDDRAFVWREGTMYDLNEWLDSAEPWHLVEARGINDRGEIVGYGILRDRERAFLLTPLPGPASERPVVRLVEPTHGTAWSAGAPLPLKAEIEPSGASVRRVLFFANGVPVAAATSAPYQAVWTQPGPGPQHLVAVVVAPDGKTRRSARVAVYVDWEEAEKRGDLVQ